MFFYLDCYPEKYTIPGIDTCKTNVIKWAPDRKDDHGSKYSTPSIFVMEENIEYDGADGNWNYEESMRMKPTNVYQQLMAY